MLRLAGTAVGVALLYAVPALLRRLGAHALVAWLFVEDGALEGLGAAAVLAGGLLLLYAALALPAPSRAARIVRLLFGLLLIVMCGEEINWGQRLAGFATPDWFQGAAATGEFNLHNLRQFQTGWQVNPPTSWWQLGTFGLLVIVPLTALHPAVHKFCERCGLPVTGRTVAWSAAGAFLGMLVAANYGLPAENSEIQETIVECLLLIWTVQAVRADLPVGPRPWLLPASAAALLLAACGLRLASLSPAAVQRERASVFTSMGAQLLGRGQTAEAQVYLDEALAVDPQNPAARYFYGLAHLKSGRLDEAIAAFREAIASDEKFAQAYCSLGIALAAAGRMAEARSALERALQLEPTLTEARQVLDQLPRTGS